VASGSQRIKWLAHVGIARWDEENHQGWKRLGVPVGARTISYICRWLISLAEVTTSNGVILDMGGVIKEGLLHDF
jgi:hypothetical protein